MPALFEVSRGLQQVFSPQDVIEKPSFSGRARPEHVILATYSGSCLFGITTRKWNLHLRVVIHIRQVISAQSTKQAKIYAKM
jgi:hypothetical protein